METKKCDSCHELRSLDLFGKNRSRRDGLHTTCKECKRLQDKKYHDKNKSNIKIKNKEYYEKNKQEIIKKVCEYAVNNRSKCNKLSVKTRKRLKKLVLGHYCGGEPRCQKCPECDLRVLTIDHINGGGNKHRKEIGVTSAGHNFYRWLKKNNFPDGFQVLCMSCQYRKRKEEMTPAVRTPRQVQLAEQVQRVKSKCLEQYGRICSCGECDSVVLSLDHVNDDGAEHRREVGVSGTGFYYHLIRSGFPNDPPLQVMCMNCQYRKRDDEGEDGPTGDIEGAAVSLQGI